jgi:alkylation response protein AidB-like acyl-CoA dehydrogenase
MIEQLLSSITALSPQIFRRADALDMSGGWPAEDLQALAAAGVFNMAIPISFGGPGTSALDQHRVYEELAAQSLSVALILSQRDAAIGLIEGSQTLYRDELLGRLAAGAFSSVGIAQLTTSRQGGPPALQAERTAEGFRVDGLIPWCTGAAKAGFIVAGAAVEVGRHVLFALPTDADGVKIDPPMPLVAMRSTWTASIHCEGVEIPDSAVLCGPAEKVLMRANHLPLGQAFLAMGVCRGAVNLIANIAGPGGPDRAREAMDRFESQISSLRFQINSLSQPGLENEAMAHASVIRGQCNDLALRITHAAVAMYKGTGLLVGHPAQRLAREALFLLVWSCPNPVIDCTIDLLSAGCAPGARP